MTIHVVGGGTADPDELREYARSVVGDFDLVEAVRRTAESKPDFQLLVPLRSAASVRAADLFAAIAAAAEGAQR